MYLGVAGLRSVINAKIFEHCNHYFHCGYGKYFLRDYSLTSIYEAGKLDETVNGENLTVLDEGLKFCYNYEYNFKRNVNNFNVNTILSLF